MAGSSEVKTLMCRHKASLLRELNATNLLNVLVKRGVISEVDRDAVAGNADRSSETDIDLFIDVIGTKGFNAFWEFCFALEAECPHVLTKLLVDHHGVNGEEQRQHSQQKQSLLDDEDLDVKIDTMGQLPTPVKHSEEYSQTSNGNVDINHASDNEKKESADVETRRCSGSSEFQECTGPGGISSQIAPPASVSIPPVNHHRESYFPSNGIDSNSDPILEVFEEPVDEPVQRDESKE